MSNIWLKIDGIEGLATDLGHEGEIEVLSWWWGLTKSSRNAVGKATTVHHLSIVRDMDAVTPSLISCMTMNKVAKEAVLSLRSPFAQAIPGGIGKVIPPKDATKIIMKNVLIMKISPRGSAVGHFEQVTLSFDEVRFESVKMKAGIPCGTAIAQYVCRPDNQQS
ncbi:hypothetical protein BTHE68_13760 [Burkholderia sp. THE68]|uniref:type VI secretion system tube protein Hcp n=1 Tax=Burkholderia sp. THE68 TaxID=758782 RepID=UPI001316D0C6|nr:type VI secretion system tube protein Hcp [Burkholderia sp. THE68]BBU27642.1 hypothetical protein BTHE68_13760 [Burkholderia sp. THE68]